MIKLTRLNGEKMVINADLIQRIEANPDTVLTLSDGIHYVVREPVDEIIAAVKYFQASVLAEAAFLARSGDLTPALRLVTGSDQKE